MHFLVKWIKFSVKKNKTLKKYWKNGKNTGKSGKSQGILSVQKSGNPAFLLDSFYKNLIYNRSTNFTKGVKGEDLESNTPCDIGLLSSLKYK